MPLSNPTLFRSWLFQPILSNLTLVYRRSFSSLWRRLKEPETLKLEASDKAVVYEVAKKPADISGSLSGVMYRRIIPKCVDESKAVKDLYAKISDKSVDVLMQPKLFCELFLNCRPLRYQLALLEDSSRQVAVRERRQSGKTVSLLRFSIHIPQRGRWRIKCGCTNRQLKAYYDHQMILVASNTVAFFSNLYDHHSYG